MSAPRVAVVGCCASGKTSVVARLRELGFDAYSVAQEHSIISGLWRHLEPDRLVLLDVLLDTIRKRRQDDGWPQWIYELQQSRLRDARANAHVVVATDGRDLGEVVDEIVKRLTCQ